MPFHDHFSSAATGYAAARPTYPAALFEWIAANAPARGRVWDAACGNGQAAVGLAGHFAHVVATDASHAQIAAARGHAGVSYSVQLSEAPAFATGAFDAVTAAAALHWFEPAPFFAGVTRVLRPGGLFAAWSYHQLFVTDAIDRELERLLLSRIKLSWAPQCPLSWNGYRDVPMPYPRLAVPAFQIELRWTMAHLVGFVRTWSGFRTYCAEHGEAWFDEVLDRVGSLWGTEARPVVLPIDVLAGRRAG